MGHGVSLRVCMPSVRVCDIASVEARSRAAVMSLTAVCSSFVDVSECSVVCESVCLAHATTFGHTLNSSRDELGASSITKFTTNGM